MKWSKAGTDEPPEDQQSVLISVNGIYYDAIYIKGKDHYVSKGFRGIEFSPEGFIIYWSVIAPPVPEKIIEKGE